MPITFNSAGGFLNGTISSSNGDIFITTSGSVGAINVGTQLQLTGSQVIEKDTSGKIRNKRIFNSDGTITEQKFDASEKITETKVKDPTTGKEFFRSGSSTTNQIEFKQDGNSAVITTSGSGIVGFNIIGTNDSDPAPGFFQRKDTGKGTIYSQNVGTPKLISTGQDSAGNYYISVDNGAPISSATFSPELKVSRAGDVSMSGNLQVLGDISAQEFHTTYVSSSIIFSSGSTQFGDSIDDTHTFTGSLNVYGTGSFDNKLSVGGLLDVDGGMSLDGNLTLALDNFIKLGASNRIGFPAAPTGVKVHGALTVEGEISSSDGIYKTKASEHKFEGNISSSGATIYNVKQFADGDTTPNVSSGTMFKTANSTNCDITGFDNGSAGQIIYILIQDNNTDFSDGTNLQLYRGLDHDSAQINDTITFACVDGTKWVELGRSDNT
jgi:hypothetical protein